MIHQSGETRTKSLKRRSAGALLALGVLAALGAPAGAQSSEALTLERLFDAAAASDAPVPAEARADAALALIDLLERTEVRRVHYQELEVLDAMLRSVTTRFEVGEVTRTDVAVVRTRREAANARAIAANGERDAARARIALLYGLPADSPQASSLRGLLASVPPDLETAIAMAAESTDLSRAELRAQITQDWERMAGYRDAKAAWGPAREAVEAAFDGAVEEGVVGVRSTEDVLDAREQMTRIRLEMAANEYDYWRSVVAVLGSIGAFGAGASQVAPPPAAAAGALGVGAGEPIPPLTPVGAAEPSTDEDLAARSAE
jgi:outer membrane protein TolC